MIKTLKTAIRLLRNCQFRTIKNILRERIYSNATAYGLECRLDSPLYEPVAKVPISLRTYEEGDLETLLMHGELYRTDPDTADNQTALLKAGLGTCYIATDEKDQACFMQLVIGPDENRRIQEYLGGIYPKIKDGEALLEGAYTHPAYRGRGIMPATIARIANLVRIQDVLRLVTFVYTDNAPSLKACQKAGLSPFTLRTTRWLLFRKTVIFEPLANQIPRTRQSRLSSKTENLT